jgi:hypothetical protein
MNNNYNINCHRDLQREEMRVKKRLKEQEEALRNQFKKLPEEIVIMGVTKVITSFTSGGIINSGGKIIRSIVSYFIQKNEGEGVIQNGIKKFIVSVLDKIINKNDVKE